jgi:hypothetical protein
MSSFFKLTHEEPFYSGLEPLDSGLKASLIQTQNWSEQMRTKYYFSSAKSKHPKLIQVLTFLHNKRTQ